MWITWWKSVEKNLTLTHKMLGFVPKSRWDIEFKHFLSFPNFIWERNLS